MTWITDRPLLSHGLLGLLYTSLLIAAFHFCGITQPEFTAFLCVVTHFYSREVGQLGHELRGEHGEAKASLMALGPAWNLYTVAQVLSPTISAGAVSLVASLLLRG